MTDSHVLSIIADLKSRVYDLEQTVARLEERDAQIQQSMNGHLVQHNNRLRALERVVAVPPQPAVEPTGYEETDSEKLLDNYIGVMIDGLWGPARNNMRREILIRMQQGSGA